MKWVSVKERLPEQELEVLILQDNGTYWVATFINDKWLTGYDCCGEVGLKKDQVEYWMPLPPFPGKEQ